MSHFGLTYSHTHTKYLGLDPIFTLKEITSMPISFVRLCTYWKEVEEINKSFDFDLLDTLIEICEKKNIKIILTVGIKAPRWPEYHIPIWTSTSSPDFEQHVQTYLEKTLKHYKNTDSISHIQIENEPLDASGINGEIVNQNLLRLEFELIKKYFPSRPVLGTLWGNEMIKRDVAPSLTKYCDEFGIDLYYKVPKINIGNHTIYRKPDNTTDEMKEYLNKLHKPVWITELQAEPWEKDQKNYKSASPGSISTSQIKNNFREAMKLDPIGILFWGAEYWVWREKYLKDTSYLKTVCELLSLK